MKKRIFKMMMLVAALVLIVSMGAVLFFTYHYFETRSMAMMQNEADYIAHALKTQGISYFTGLNPKNRVTWIAADGNVLYDSDADAAAMENHADRPEVLEAQKNGVGYAQRNSLTVGSKTLYYAVLMEDGSILRVSCEQRTIYQLFLDMLELMLCIIAIVLVFGAVLSYKTAKRIVAPINEIDLEHPEESETYDELSPLLYRMIKQKHNIAAQMKALRASRDELNAIIKNMSEGFLLINREKKILALNDSVLELFGKPNGEIIGSHIIVLSRNAQLLSVVDQALEGENAEAIVQIGTKSYELMGNPVEIEGVRNGATVFILDVTERAQAEQLRRRFSANVSHELKTPLTSIAGYAEIMQSGMVKDEDIPDFAGRIKQEATRLIHLVEDIIKLSRLDEKNVALEKERVDMLTLVNRVAGLLAKEASAKHVDITVAGEENAYVLGVPVILEEMIYNLCDNAIKYNKQGGNVQLGVKALDKSVEVTVCDTGIGIEKDEQEKVFERFYRVDKSHSKQTGGTGLGLSIVKHGAMFHDAKIEMDSRVGEGTCIKLIFKRAEQQ